MAPVSCIFCGHIRHGRASFIDFPAWNVCIWLNLAGMIGRRRTTFQSKVLTFWSLKKDWTALLHGLNCKKNTMKNLDVSGVAVSLRFLIIDPAYIDPVSTLFLNFPDFSRMGAQFGQLADSRQWLEHCALEHNNGDMSETYNQLSMITGCVLNGVYCIHLYTSAYHTRFGCILSVLSMWNIRTSWSVPSFCATLTCLSLEIRTL